MKRNTFLYPVLIGFFACFTWFLIYAGKDLKPASAPAGIVTPIPATELNPAVPSNIQTTTGAASSFLRLASDPVPLLLIQILVILFIAKLFGVVLKRFGQPAVVGEMIAGIALGPSVMGMLLPDLSAWLFPKGSFDNLRLLSQVALVFFMFVVGMELNLGNLKNKARHAVVISHASIIFPYFLGVAVSHLLYVPFAPATAGFTEFALFMGIAVSITAFPVLARILEERGLTRTPLGVIAIACAAFDDVTAWCILAAVVAIAKSGSATGALTTIALSVVFVLVMLYVIRPAIRKLSLKHLPGNQPDKLLLAVLLLIPLLAAFITEAIGIHALFGAFLAGLIVPSQANLKEILVKKVTNTRILWLLPLFFAFTGLRTQLGLLDTGHLWATFALVLFVAIAGKFGGSSIAARLTGQSWKDSLSIGALMNTRGLMELIALNIGYDLGILSPALFAMMVFMALITTFMTGPLLDLIASISRKVKT